MKELTRVGSFHTSEARQLRHYERLPGALCLFSRPCASITMQYNVFWRG
jgi:hypothetical protein